MFAVSRRHRLLDGDRFGSAAELYTTGKSLVEIGEELGANRRLWHSP